MDIRIQKEISKSIFIALNKADTDNYKGDNLNELTPFICIAISNCLAKDDIRSIFYNQETLHYISNKITDVIEPFTEVEKPLIKSTAYLIGLQLYFNTANSEAYATLNLESIMAETLTNTFFSLKDSTKSSFLTRLCRADYLPTQYPKYYLLDKHKELYEVSETLIDGLNQSGIEMVYGIKYKPFGHVFKQHINCKEDNCIICDGGIGDCLQCGQVEGELTETCCEHVLTDKEKDFLVEKFNLYNQNEIFTKLEYMLGIWYKSEDSYTSSETYETLREKFYRNLNSFFNQLDDKVLTISEYKYLQNYIKQHLIALMESCENIIKLHEDIRQKYLPRILSPKNLNKSYLYDSLFGSNLKKCLKAVKAEFSLEDFVYLTTEEYINLAKEYAGALIKESQDKDINPSLDSYSYNLIIWCSNLIKGSVNDKRLAEQEVSKYLHSFTN